MLAEEADDWWVATRTEMEQDGTVLTWVVFRRDFLRRYFPEDIRGEERDQIFGAQAG